MSERLGHLIQPLAARWQAYSRQERLTWGVIGAASVIVVLWLYVWQPFSERYTQAQVNLERAQQNLEWMQQIAPRVRAAVGSAGQTVVTDSAQSMTNAISQMAREHDLDLTRFEQSGEDGLRFWLDGQPFDDVLLWIAALETQGLRVEQMTISQTGQSGLVNVRGVFARQ